MIGIRLCWDPKDLESISHVPKGGALRLFGSSNRDQPY